MKGIASLVPCSYLPFLSNSSILASFPWTCSVAIAGWALYWGTRQTFSLMQDKTTVIFHTTWAFFMQTFTQQQARPSYIHIHIIYTAVEWIHIAIQYSYIIASFPGSTAQRFLHFGKTYPCFSKVQKTLGSGAWERG